MYLFQHKFKSNFTVSLIKARKEVLKSNDIFVVLDSLWESPRGPETKKIWVLRKNLVWVLIHVISGLLIQTLRGADTKPPGC